MFWRVVDLDHVGNIVTVYIFENVGKILVVRLRGGWEVSEHFVDFAVVEFAVVNDCTVGGV